ncbi:hypothetical protein LguiA_008834 [Lonicera macranthoides]
MAGGNTERTRGQQALTNIEIHTQSFVPSINGVLNIYHVLAKYELSLFLASSFSSLITGFAPILSNRTNIVQYKMCNIFHQGSFVISLCNVDTMYSLLRIENVNDSC